MKPSQKLKAVKLDELATKRDLKDLELKIAETKADLTRVILSVGVGVVIGSDTDTPESLIDDLNTKYGNRLATTGI